MEKNTSQCKYFVYGACSKGKSCIYAHDLNAKKDNVCKFYLAGTCTYGSACRYDHVKQKQKVLKPTTLSNQIEKSGNLCVLKKKITAKEFNQNWIQAAEFVPGKKYHASTEEEEEPKEVPPHKTVSNEMPYSTIASLNLDDFYDSSVQEEDCSFTYEGDSSDLLCPFAAVRECPYGESCEYQHGDRCDICDLQCLHPNDEKQRSDHRSECLAHHEDEMKRAFAAQRSDGVVCSICLDVVKEKSDMTERMFGLLENCDHAFCLSCIRNWRSSSHQDKIVVRSCPICRVSSWFVTPSEFWVSDAEEKKTIIDNYKNYLSTKSCRNFDQGRGECRFGSSCFYKHELPDGNLDVSKPNLRYREDSEGLSQALQTTRLNEFIAVRDAT